MMDINAKATITLDDGKSYIVTSKVVYEGKEYIYIADIDDPSNVKFAQIESNGTENYISEIDSKEKTLLDKLLPLFFNDCKKIIETYEEE